LRRRISVPRRGWWRRGLMGGWIGCRGLRRGWRGMGCEVVKLVVFL